MCLAGSFFTGSARDKIWQKVKPAKATKRQSFITGGTAAAHLRRVTSDVSARTLRSLHLPAGRTDRTIACLSALNQLDHRVEFNPWTWAIVPCHGPLLDATWKVTVGLFRAWFPPPASPHEGPWEESVPYNQSTKQPTECYHDIILSVKSIYGKALEEN